jgi:hypothetical protein
MLTTAPARTAKSYTPPSARPAYVVVDGPYTAQDAYSGDEYPVWTISICDCLDRELKHYETRSYARAEELGGQIARDRKVELVWEAMPA